MTTYAIQYFNQRTWITPEWTFTNDPALAFVTPEKFLADAVAAKAGSQAQVVEVVGRSEASE